MVLDHLPGFFPKGGARVGPVWTIAPLCLGRPLCLLLRTDLLDHHVIGEQSRIILLLDLFRRVSRLEDDEVVVVSRLGRHVVLERVVKGDELLLVRCYDLLLRVGVGCRRLLSRLHIRALIGLNHLRNVPLISRAV